jgi:preprotein translocase subunit YajC
MAWVMLGGLFSATAAWADAPAAAPAMARDGLSPFIPMILIFVVLYFMMIRPQQKRAKQHQEFVTNLKRGDLVVTNGGIIGTIKTVSDRFVTLEVDNNVHLKMLRSQIAESASALNKEDDKEKAKS